MLGPYCQDLRPIFSQYGPRAWLITYMYMYCAGQWSLSFAEVCYVELLFAVLHGAVLCCVLVQCALKCSSVLYNMSC